MARACSKALKFKHLETDDVEKSLELLDKVLSEFEDPDSLPPIVEPDSPSQGHQSEDDGYMSMNGRRAKFSPGFQPTDEAPMAVLAVPPVPVPPDEKSPPPSPEEAERIISNFLPRCSPDNTIDTNSGHRKESISRNSRKDKLLFAEKLNESATPFQTTLPKARPSTVIPSRYASLPCSSPPRLLFGQLSHSGGGSIDGDRTILGIGISAVHDAVLRGVARIPESIVNEHPVTIYPGRSSPTKRVPPRTLAGSIERHRDVCRINVNNDTVDFVACTSREDLATYPPPPLEPSIKFSHHIIPQYNPSTTTMMKMLPSPPPTLLLTKNRSSAITTVAPPSPPPSPTDMPSSVCQPITVNNHQHQHHNLDGDSWNNNRRRCIDANRKSDCDDFSDDSLEGQSLPPPPPPLVVPPPPSLSAPVTPSKRSSIAWEINLDDHYDEQANRQQQSAMSTRSEKFTQKRRATSVSGSQSSLLSTSGTSIASLECRSAEWPEPPEMPAICSTEDEATSLYSDSADDIIPYANDLKGGHGTYVIRKGRKERHRLSELDASIGSPNTKPIVPDDHLVKTNAKFVSSIGLPFSRHSIDLGSTHQPPVQNSLHHPRSRLSLDLSSPTSELPAMHPTAANTTATNSSTAVLSPRYSEFKMYNSTFDGLHALDTTASHNGGGGSGNDLNGSGNNINNMPLMRVASLPSMSPAHSGEKISTPRRELAPPIEEDEEQDSESQRGAPLRQIENNISALLRGDIIVARVGDIAPPRRPLGFRPGVHKSESAKEMLLSQTIFGPLPPSPSSSSPEEIDGFPPLPPSPLQEQSEDFVEIVNGIHSMSLSSHSKVKSDMRHSRDAISGTGERPPAVPPHRGPSINTLKTRSMDAGFSKSCRTNGPYTSPHYPGHNGSHDVHGSTTRKRFMSGAFPKRAAQSPREERRLQTSCSLPETPIFARGCDVPRTPHRRAPELPGPNPIPGGSRTAPRQTTGLNSSVIGIGPTTIGNRQRSISQALAGGEMLRLAGGPARGWYPRQRHPRPASTENLDRLNPQGSIRAWDTGTGSRKPLTLPPNLTPKFFNKSPREALRRVTSLLIRKGNGGKEAKREKEIFAAAVCRSPGASGETVPPTATPTPHKKKGFFKSFWKKSKHYSLEQ